MQHDKFFSPRVRRVYTRPLTMPCVALGSCIAWSGSVGAYLGGQLLLLRCGSGPTSPSVGPAVHNLPTHTWDHFLSQYKGLCGAWMWFLLRQTGTQIHVCSVHPVQTGPAVPGSRHSCPNWWLKALRCLNQFSGNFSSSHKQESATTFPRLPLG